MLLSFIIFSIFSFGKCDHIIPGAEEYFQKRGRGSVSLQSSLDPSLCVRTVKLNENIKSLQLINCKLDFDNYPYEGDDTFIVGIYNANIGGPQGKTYYTLETESYTTDADGSEKAVVSFVARQDDGFVIAQPRDWSNYTLWRYPKVDGDKILVAHQKPLAWSEQCLHAPKIENGTKLDTIDCNNDDQKQIWISRFKGINELKVYNTEYDKEPAVAPAKPEQQIEPEKQSSKKNLASILQTSAILPILFLSYLCRHHSSNNV